MATQLVFSFGVLLFAPLVAGATLLALGLARRLRAYTGTGELLIGLFVFGIVNVYNSGNHAETVILLIGSFIGGGMVFHGLGQLLTPNPKF